MNAHRLYALHRRGQTTSASVKRLEKGRIYACANGLTVWGKVADEDGASEEGLVRGPAHRRGIAAAIDSSVLRRSRHSGSGSCRSNGHHGLPIADGAANSFLDTLYKHSAAATAVGVARQRRCL